MRALLAFGVLVAGLALAWRAWRRPRRPELGSVSEAHRAHLAGQDARQAHGRGGVEG